MDQALIEELERVKVVEPGNERNFRKKGSNAVKMTARTFSQFIYNKKGGLFNNRISFYNSVREKMQDEVEKMKEYSTYADSSRYSYLAEKLSKIGAKILWAEEKENFVHRESKKLKVPAIVIRTISPFRNFFVRKKYNKVYKKQIETAANDVFINTLKGEKNSFTLPKGEDLTVRTLHGFNDAPKNNSNFKKASGEDSSNSSKTVPLNEILENKNKEELTKEIKSEEDIKKHLDFYFKKISSYSEEEYTNILEKIEKSSEDIQFNISDYIKMNFKDYVKDFVLKANFKKPSEEEIKTFNRYDALASKYRINFSKIAEEIYKEEEERLLKEKEVEEKAKKKGQINPDEIQPKNNRGIEQRYKPFDFSNYKKDSNNSNSTSEPLNQQNQGPGFNNNNNDTSVPLNQQNQATRSNNNSNNQADTNVDLNNLYKEYNPTITYDYNYGVINDDLRNLSENELIREEKKINEAFLSYVFLKHGKSPRELLNNIQDYVEETNKSRIEHNKEILNAENNRDIVKKELSLLEKVEEIPQDYYLHSVYSNEFFKDNPDQFDRTKKLANEVMRRIEAKELEKRKILEQKKEAERIKTGRLVLKYGLGGYYADPNTKLNDQEVLEMINLLEGKKIYKDAIKRAGMRVREIKEERMKSQQAYNNQDNFKVR